MTALYRVADRAKCAEWSVPIRPLNAAPLLTHSMTHYVDSIYDDSTAQTQSFGVYESGNDKPLCAGRGEPLALSDDGRFVAVKSEAAATTLYDTAQNKAVLRMAVENADKNNYYQMTVAFSGDGQRMGIVLHPNLEVVTLTEGFPRRKMALPPGEDAFSIWGANQACCLCFSPDGTRLLSAGYGHAWLHDAATGALLHDFEETEEFTNQHQYSNGFLQEIANSAKDWAGMVTDRFKRSCQLEVAFSQNGAQVITLAAGQVIRVWDAASGKLLHTIHTELPEKRDKNGSINNCIRLSANGDYAFCFNNDNFGDASLWSLIDGTLIHRYQLPTGHYNRDEVAVAEDGSRVLIEMDSDIFQWPGKPLR